MCILLCSKRRMYILLRVAALGQVDSNAQHGFMAWCIVYRQAREGKGMRSLVVGMPVNEGGIGVAGVYHFAEEKERTSTRSSPLASYWRLVEYLAR